MDMLERITTDPQICHGKACIKGTRIPVAVILDHLAVGILPQAILHSYPTLAPGDIQAAIAYAASLAREQVVLLDSLRS